MDFDKPKVYGDTSITDGLVVFPQVDANQLGELRSEEHCFSTEGIYDEEAVGL